jgi:hypothetical protein
MPTLLRIGKFAFRLYPNDHPPPHIHVVTSEGEARVQLHPEVALLGVGGLKKPDAVKAMNLTRQHQDLLLRAWRDWHEKQDR